MNALTVICLAVCSGVVVCRPSNGRLLQYYPGVYNYPGLLGAYPYHYQHAAPLSVNTLATSPVTYTVPHEAPAPVTYTVPHVVQAPVAYSVPPVAPIKSQYHSQDELGQYSFGYAGGPSSRAETRDAYGVVRGSYNYVDSEGEVQTQHYVADALGFRVAGTNLPVSDTPAPVALPVAVQDTPEVAAAKVAFKIAFDEAAAAAAAAPDSDSHHHAAEEPHHMAAEETHHYAAEETHHMAAEETHHHAAEETHHHAAEEPHHYAAEETHHHAAEETHHH